MQNKPKSAKSEIFKKIKPLGDRVVVLPLEAESGKEKKTASGIFIPDTGEREKPEQGTVVAVGEGRYDDGEREPMEVKVGDKVVFAKYGYDEIKLDGKKYFILKQENILAILR